MTNNAQPKVPVTGSGWRDRRIAELEAQLAEAHSILASVLVTCRQRAVSAMDFLVKVQRAAGGAAPSLVSAPALDTS